MLIEANVLPLSQTANYKSMYWIGHMYTHGVQLFRWRRCLSVDCQWTLSQENSIFFVVASRYDNNNDNNNNNNNNIAFVWQCCESSASMFTFTLLLIVLDPPLANSPCVRHWPHRPGCITCRSVSPWAICLRVDANQYLTALVMMVQNKYGHLAESSYL